MSLKAMIAKAKSLQAPPPPPQQQQQQQQQQQPTPPSPTVDATNDLSDVGSPVTPKTAELMVKPEPSHPVIGEDFPPPQSTTQSVVETSCEALQMPLAKAALMATKEEVAISKNPGVIPSADKDVRPSAGEDVVDLTGHSGEPVVAVASAPSASTVIDRMLRKRPRETAATGSSTVGKPPAMVSKLASFSDRVRSGQAAFLKLP